MSSPVRHRLVAVCAAVCAVLLSFVVASCGSQSQTPSAPSTVSGSTDAKGGGTEQCGPGGIKDERAPYTATAPTGQVISAICVKSGRQSIPVSAGDACYTVTYGTGNTTATVSKTGSGSDCRDISYVTFYTASPTPTATPTDVATPTPTNTPTDTPTTTGTPTPTNTPTNTPVAPTATPTNTPTNTPVSPTPTPTNTPTNTPVTPTSTPTNTPTNTPAPPTPTPTNTPTNTPPAIRIS